MTLDPAALGWSLDPVAPVTWRLEVSGPTSSWTATLEERRQRLTRASARQDEAAARLTAFAAAPDTIPFAARALPAMPATPEAELAGLLEGSPEPMSLAFGPIDGLQRRWQSAVDRLDAALDRLARFVGSLALVETVIAGTSIARTAIAIDGDLRTAWRADVTAAAVALHTAAIETAQATRRQVARGLRLLFEGAALLVTLPALATNPAGLLVALPAIWHFIERVMDDPATV